MENIVNRISKWYRDLPEKKKYVEFITAVLSVPVMLTVIIINLSNLNQQKSATNKAANDKTTPIQVIITEGKQGERKEVPIDVPTTTSVPCTREVGPVSILSPRENELVVRDRVCITISTQSSYCSVIWSYRLDDGDWSDFTDKNICLHNLSNGNKTIQLKIKSALSNDEVTLQRSFIYQGNNEPTFEPSPATSSANL